MSNKSKLDVELEALDSAQAEREIGELSAQIRAHDAAYYQEDAPKIDDAAYDHLRQRLLALESAFPQLRSDDSPSLAVGAAPSGRFAKVAHSVAMLSLGNAFSDADLDDFIDRIKRFLGLDEQDELTITLNQKSMVCRFPFVMKVASWCWGPPEAMARQVKMSPIIS